MIQLLTKKIVILPAIALLGLLPSMASARTYVNFGVGIGPVGFGFGHGFFAGPRIGAVGFFEPAFCAPAVAEPAYVAAPAPVYVSAPACVAAPAYVAAPAPIYYAAPVCAPPVVYSSPVVVYSAPGYYYGGRYGYFGGRRVVYYRR